ncbi:hypothetical protein [Kitasatospora sp. GP82]|uniref:hypothetical protein n=1 Tax=Kitasatospora sp. GP82 TaxID=3035089 RepID=UPI002475C862|nr:hypothetical protein [Kitasatospora sp. GP82]
MTAPNPFGHPCWGLQFFWWAVDPAGFVGLFQSAFGPVPSAANAHARAVDEATARARRRHPEWFDARCLDDACPEQRGEECPVTHCLVRLARGPYLFTWDEEHDDRYTRYGVPKRPVPVSELPGDLAAAARLVEVGFTFDRAVRIDLSYPGGQEVLSATYPASTGG